MKFLTLRRWCCRKFGHSYSTISLIIFEIKTNELNNDMSATITCQRCGNVGVHKDSPLAVKE